MRLFANPSETRVKKNHLLPRSLTLSVIIVDSLNSRMLMCLLKQTILQNNFSLNLNSLKIRLLYAREVTARMLIFLKYLLKDFSKVVKKGCRDICQLDVGIVFCSPVRICSFVKKLFSNLISVLVS